MDSVRDKEHNSPGQNGPSILPLCKTRSDSNWGVLTIFLRYAKVRSCEVVTSWCLFFQKAV